MKRHAKKTNKLRVVFGRSIIVLVVLSVCVGLCFAVSSSTAGLLLEQERIKAADELYEQGYYAVAIASYEAIDSYQHITERIADSKEKLAAEKQTLRVTNGEVAEVSIGATEIGDTYTWYIKDPDSSQWYKSRVTSAEYSCNMTAERSGLQVYCVITDEDGNQVTTEVATLMYESDE